MRLSLSLSSGTEMAALALVGKDGAAQVALSSSHITIPTVSEVVEAEKDDPPLKVVSFCTNVEEEAIMLHPA